MTAPQPPTTEPPAQTQTQQQAPAPAPEVSPEDRILSPEETENLLRGLPTNEPSEPDDTPPDQQQMVRDFFSEIPPERTPEQTPAALPPRPPGQDPRQVPQQVPLPHEQVQQMVQQQMAPSGPTPEMPPSAIQDMVQQTIQGGGPTQAPQAAAPQQVPVQTPPSPETAALQAQNQILQSQIQALQQTMQQMQAQPPQAQPQGRPGYQQPGEQPQMDYNFQVPPQYLAAIQSENPAEAQYALNMLLNNVAQTVTNQIRQENQGLREEVGGIVQQQMGNYNTQQEVQRDMYGTYPELQPYRHLVQATARELGQSMPPNTPWTPELRDQIAERVSPMVPGLYQKIQQQRAMRVGYQQAPQQPVPQQAQYQQPLPQQQQPAGLLPPGVRPVGMAGGMHGQPVPTLARDAAGNLVHVQGAPQPYLGSPQARAGGSAVSPEVQDIWRTLGYEPYQ